MRRTESRGVTLIEFLVVIAILALLLAIILPTLERARVLSRRTVCLSNLRSQSLLYAAYANNFYGLVPTGYTSNTKQFNYVVSWSGNNASGNFFQYYTMNGLLHLTGMLTAPKAFYCPAETSSQFLYDGLTGSVINPWPPRTTAPGTITRLGYGTRPTSCWPYVDDQGIGFISWPARMDRLIEFQQKAMVADIVSWDTWVDRRHGDGVNTLYGDLSVRWVPRKVFGAQLAPFSNPPGMSPPFNDNMLSNDGSRGVFPALDSAR